MESVYRMTTALSGLGLRVVRTENRHETLPDSCFRKNRSTRTSSIDNPLLVVRISDRNGDRTRSRLRMVPGCPHRTEHCGRRSRPSATRPGELLPGPSRPPSVMRRGFRTREVIPSGESPSDGTLSAAVSYQLRFAMRSPSRVRRTPQGDRVLQSGQGQGGRSSC